MILPDFLADDDGGFIHVANHRVGLGEIVYHYREGDSPEMLHLRYPTIGLAIFHKVIAFYLENQPDIDDYCGRYDEEMARQRAAARTGPSLEELRQRRASSRLAPGA